MLNAILVCLGLDNFDNSDMYGRKKYARFCELSFKTDKTKIQAVSCHETQMRCENFAQKWKIYCHGFGTTY